MDATSVKGRLLLMFVAAISISCMFAIYETRWVGSKTVKLQLPPGTNLNQATFYECFCTLEELKNSQSIADFRKVDSVSYQDNDTVILRLTITGVDYPIANWCDSRTEPTLILTVIEDSTGLVTEQLVAQNSPGRQNLLAVALAKK